MVRLVAIIALCCLGLPAAAAQLQGQWIIQVPAIPEYRGVVLIDADGRVTWEAPNDSGKPVKDRGYVARSDDHKVELALTDRKTVARAHCTTQVADVLHCYLTFTHTDRVSSGFILRRVGPGPQKLVP